MKGSVGLTCTTSPWVSPAGPSIPSAPAVLSPQPAQPRPSSFLPPLFVSPHLSHVLLLLCHRDPLLSPPSRSPAPCAEPRPAEQRRGAASRRVSAGCAPQVLLEPQTLAWVKSRGRGLGALKSMCGSSWHGNKSRYKSHPIFFPPNQSKIKTSFGLVKLKQNSQTKYCRE